MWTSESDGYSKPSMTPTQKPPNRVRIVIADPDLAECFANVPRVRKPQVAKHSPRLTNR